MHHLWLRDIKGVPKHMIPAAYINGEGTAAVKKGYGVRAVSSHRVRFGHKHELIDQFNKMQVKPSKIKPLKFKM